MRRIPLPLATLALALALAAALPAQSTTASADRAARLAELDRDVWRPFLEGVRLDSAELYVGIRARDFHWVAPGERGRIMDLAEYDDDSRQVMRRRRASGGSTELDVRFLERNVTATFAVEKTVSRYVIRNGDGTERTGFGIAHSFARKEEDGRWRLFLHHGSPERATAETFAAATPMHAVPGAPTPT